MSRIIKHLGELATEETIQGLVGKLLHVPTNKHVINNPMEGDKEETVNAWFAGQVAGYEKAFLVYDYESGEFFDEPHVFYNILLTDGKGYMLELSESEIVELTDTEWTEMITEHQSIEIVTDTAQSLLVPDRKIILSDEVK
ncbi:hypothetical protein [Peribacillus frigoritolerans]|uniref:Uncharacterized protein n=1 Tax=Peribacillus castrilensis TaxID=2897690 RepID=A0AAW9NJN4_9BACI|nr:hypothetical protein [Peribacillus castrilensis]